MNIFNDNKKDGFISTIDIETVNNLDDKRMLDMINKFSGYYFNEVKYHIKEHYGMAALILYCNNAPNEDKIGRSTLHVVFCVDPKYEQLAKPMIEGMYKRFIRTAYKSVEGNEFPIFSIGENSFCECLSNDEENNVLASSKFAPGHQHPLLDVIEHIWIEEENDDNREEGKII